MSLYESVIVALPAVCPVAPPGAQGHVDNIIGYVLWGVFALFGVGLIVSLGAIVGGRIFAMQHASKAGILGIAMIFAAGLAYLVLPPILKTMMGTGCI